MSNYQVETLYGEDWSPYGRLYEKYDEAEEVAGKVAAEGMDDRNSSREPCGVRVVSGGESLIEWKW